MIVSKIKSLDLVWRIIYIFSFNSSIKYKIWYVFWEIVKMIRLITGKKLKPFFPKYLYWDYVIKNEIWKFKIKELSDMHSIINPYTEKQLLKYFLMYQEGIFLDIWTNIWKYSILIWNRTNMKIFSFEPNTFLVNNYLSYNIKLNWLENRISLLNIWLWNIESEQNLYVRDNSFWEASLGCNGETIEWKKKFKVKIDKLDSIYKIHCINPNEVRLIKIDVEGFEYKVFLWAKEFLSKTTECVLIVEIIEETINKNDTIDLIKSLWFSLLEKMYWDNYIFYKWFKNIKT